MLSLVEALCNSNDHQPIYGHTAAQSIHAPSFQVSLAHSPESPRTYRKDTAEDNRSTWSANRQVALVSDALEAARRWQILPVDVGRHCSDLGVS